MVKKIKIEECLHPDCDNILPHNHDLPTCLDCWEEFDEEDDGECDECGESDVTLHFSHYFNKMVCKNCWVGF